MGRKELVLINLAPASSPCLLTGLLALVRRMAEKSSTILVRQRHEEWSGLTSSAATWWRPSTGSPQRRGGTRCRPPSSAGWRDERLMAYKLR